MYTTEPVEKQRSKSLSDAVGVDVVFPVIGYIFGYSGKEQLLNVVKMEECTYQYIH